jgi:hypothetical protein
MKVAATLGVMLAVLTGCGADQKTSETAPSQESTKTAQVKAYPVDWCIVSGEKLGSMGDPVSKTYQRQEVKFCCKRCVEEFEKTPAAYLAKIDSAATGLIQQPGHEGHAH